jgi:hypothetical protein
LDVTLPNNLHLKQLPISRIPLSARWLVSAIDYLKANPKIVYNGFHNAGIAERLAYEFDDEQIP